MIGRGPGPALLRAALRGSGRPLAALGGWTVLSAAPAAVSGKALALAVDRGFLAHRAPAAWLWLGVFAAGAVLSAWATRRAYRPLARIVEPARDRLVTAAAAGLLRGGPGPRGRGDGAAVAVAQVTRQVEAVRDSLAGQLLLVSHVALTVLAVVAGTAALAPAAVVPVLGPLLVAVAAFGALTPRTAAAQRALFATEEAVAASALRATGALRDLVACGAQQRAAAEVLADVAANEAAGRALARLAVLRHLLVALGVHGPLAALVLSAPVLLRHGTTTGELLGALAYLLGTLEPALRLLVQGVGPSWLRMSVAAERLAATAERDAPPSVPRPGARSRASGAALELRGVGFRYGRSPAPVLRDLDLVVADGETLAVVGPSGVGKSTFADIAAGLLAPDRGRVLIAGAPADRLPAAELARLRVLLPQDPYVFAGTLGENLRWPAAHRSAREVEAALRALGSQALTDRHGGLAAAVSAAVLSPGEQQLVALVRAYLSPARLVILDEATAHLDAAAELRVLEAFRRRPGAVVAVTHRAALAARADRVLELGDGGWRLAGPPAPPARAVGGAGPGGSQR
ncbi:ATP-binding cassette domain-containing protein [Streptomyces sp. TLI_171]|uniref:ATP-binding cassette domain-containing protein n=1 Tax=Streptomyces sp. TLI_171 TaxID=1938859 RepID=UPI000C17D0B7|nr:ATP-binding cassette domain-containing protein [Streptomyces sp. TLI_171]RKE17395.1 ATP-binding cassette subfamily C protein [Streptomyces sp. TLI_171]